MKTKKPLGIYIHIPFCIKKCNYCDFLSMPAEDEVKALYVNALIKEIQSYAFLKDIYIIDTIFFGGGTPSILREDLILNVLNHIYKEFKVSSSPEITIECNPGTLSRKKLKAYYSSGINRMSIGLQSADNDELRILGRIHTYEMFYENFSLARDTGFNNINIDLMSSLPGQTLTSYQKTLCKASELNPEHISAYSLILEEGTPFYKTYVKEMESTCTILNTEYDLDKNYTFNNKYILPSEEEDRRMYEYTKEFLLTKGYHRYEISNYSKTGYECRHNVSYWNRTDYIGIGLGASSFLQNERYKNEENLEQYIKLSSDYKKLKRETEIITEESAMEEFMYLGLRVCEGVSKNKFYALFGKKIEEIYGMTLNKMIMSGHMKEKDDMILLTDKGIDISNLILSEFLLDSACVNAK